MIHKWSGWFTSGQDDSHVVRMIHKWSGWFTSGQDDSQVVTGCIENITQLV